MCKHEVDENKPYCLYCGKRMMSDDEFRYKKYVEVDGYRKGISINKFSSGVKKMERNGKFWAEARRDEEYNVIVDVFHEFVYDEKKEYTPIYSEITNINISECGWNISECGWSGVPTGIEKEVLRNFLSD